MSSTETLESASQADLGAAAEQTAEATRPNQDQDHSQDHNPEQDEDQGHGEGNEHEPAHQHAHQQGPALNPEVTREVTVEIPADEISAAFRTITKRYGKQARIPGFRIGKVPPTLIKSRFSEQINQDVVEAVLPSHFRAAIEQQGYKPVSQPQVTSLHLVDGDPLTFTASFEVLPTIDISGYQDVKVAKPQVAVTDEEFEAELERARESRSTMEPVTEERALADGDWAQISFKGQAKPLAEGVQDEHPVDEPIEGTDVSLEVGGKNTLPAFNDALRGATVGQELKFEVDYPADFGEQRLAGKSIAYDVEIKGIKRKISPELNDDFAREMGEYESLDEFKTRLREHLVGDKQRRLETEGRDRLLEALTSRYQFPVPETLIGQQIDARLDRGLRALAQQGMREEDMRKLDFARLREAQRDAATNEVRGMLLLDRIADEEKIEIPDAELESELAMISAQTREPLDTLRSRFAQDGTLTRIREQARREKTGNLLYQRLEA